MKANSSIHMRLEIVVMTTQNKQKFLIFIVFPQIREGNQVSDELKVMIILFN